MPQSLAKVNIHLVFSTKKQVKIIDPDIEIELYPYMAKLFRECDSPALIINGTENHLHSLFLLSRKFTISQVVEKVKKTSSKWIKTKGEKYKSFFWQNGYGAFSISQSHVEIVRNYISNQKPHHRQVTFQEEYIRLLKKYEIEYDERYVWD
jgi:REP element-mobilizing transposase RayT